MAREDDIDPAGAARVLKGLARDLAAEVRRRAEAFIAQTADADTIDKTMRAVTAIARAATAVHALQAAEEKAAARALEAEAQRVAATVRARPHTLDEGDETDMNEPDPRLGTAEGVVEIRQDARQGLERFLQRLETKRAERRDDQRPDGPGGVGADHKLAVESPPVPAPA